VEEQQQDNIENKEARLIRKHTETRDPIYILLDGNNRPKNSISIKPKELCLIHGI
jgi:hypothetical protein